MKIAIILVVKYQSLRLARHLLVAQLTILFVEAVWIAMRPLNMNILQIALGIRPLCTASGSGGYNSKITMSITRINGLHKIKHAESNKKKIQKLVIILMKMEDANRIQAVRISLCTLQNLVHPMTILSAITMAVSRF